MKFFGWLFFDAKCRFQNDVQNSNTFKKIITKTKWLLLQRLSQLMLGEQGAGLHDQTDEIGFTVTLIFLSKINEIFTRQTVADRFRSLFFVGERRGLRDTVKARIARCTKFANLFAA